MVFKLEVIHWKMKALLGFLLRDKQVESYNIFSSLGDVKRILRNNMFLLERTDTRLPHVESDVSCDLHGRELMDPLGPSARILEIFFRLIITSDHGWWVAKFRDLLMFLFFSSVGFLLASWSSDH